MSRTVFISPPINSERRYTDINSYDDKLVGNQYKIDYGKGDNQARIIAGNGFPTASYFLYDAMGALCVKAT